MWAAEAAAYHIQAVLEARRRLLGADHPDVSSTLELLGQNLLKRKKYTEAEPLLRQCLKIRERQLPDNWLRFHTLSLLGGSLLAQRKYAEAEPLLCQGYEGMKQRETTIPPASTLRLIEALERLVQLYDGWGKKPEADKWRKALEARRPPAK